MTQTYRKKPVRISVTIPGRLMESLVERSTREGRSISNLAAFLIEFAMDYSRPNN